MFYVWLVLSAIATAIVVFLLGFLGYKIGKESIKMPKERTIQGVMLFGKLYTFIMNVKGYRLNNPRWSRRRYFDTTGGKEAWDILPVDAKYKAGFMERWNIYLYLWPIFKTYTYPFSYMKLKKKGDTEEGDHIIWSDESTGESVVSRTGTSNHIDFHAEHPTITGDVRTKGELAKMLVFTNNTLMATNPYKMLFGISNWLGITTETIGAALKGVVSDLSVEELNQIKSEGGDDAATRNFTATMRCINMGAPNVKDGIEELWGVRLTKSVFKAFRPADDDADRLMDSFLKPKIAEQEGNAVIIEKTKAGEADVAKAKADATAYETTKEVEVKWARETLLETGRARLDSEGRVVQQPDGNTRANAEAIKELSKTTGTVVLGGDLLSTLGINQTKGDKS